MLDMRVKIYSLRGVAVAIGMKYWKLRREMMLASKSGTSFEIPGFNLTKLGNSNHYIVTEKDIEVEYIDPPEE